MMISKILAGAAIVASLAACQPGYIQPPSQKTTNTLVGGAAGAAGASLLGANRTETALAAVAGGAIANAATPSSGF